MMLMCKNTPVYDIEKEKTLNYNLLPGLMQQKGADNHTFTKWMKYRYSSGTNTIARKLKGITFGQGARMRINRETRALSFNDCYWIKAEDDPIYQSVLQTILGRKRRIYRTGGTDTLRGWCTVKGMETGRKALQIWRYFRGTAMY